MTKPSNTNYLAKQWLLALPIIVLFGGSVLTALVVALYRGQWETVGLIIGALGFTVAMCVVISRKTHAMIHGFFQQPTPTPFTAWYQTSLAKLPDSASHTAYSQGVVYAYYGAYDQTRACLARVHWSNKAPLLAAQGLLLESLLNYLEHHHFEEAHRLAIQARTQGAVSRGFPGGTYARRGFDAYVLVGSVLCDRTDQESLNQLENLFPKLPLFVKVFVAWGLMNAYEQRSEQEKAEHMQQFLRTHAPYCRGLRKA